MCMKSFIINTAIKTRMAHFYFIVTLIVWGFKNHLMVVVLTNWNLSVEKKITITNSSFYGIVEYDQWSKITILKFNEILMICLLLKLTEGSSLCQCVCCSIYCFIHNAQEMLEQLWIKPQRVSKGVWDGEGRGKQCSSETQPRILLFPPRRSRSVSAQITRRITWHTFRHALTG